MKADFSWLRGSFPPLVTPFRDGAVDFDAYRKLVEYQIAGGSHGVVVNGTTGEPSTLSVAERNELVATAVRVAKGRIPVVAATGSQSMAETLELSQFAEKVGAAAQLIVTPYYIKPPQRGLERYFIEVLSRLSTPAMIYHIPGRAAVSMEVQTVETIARSCSNLVGIKHASTDLAFVTELLASLGRDFRIFVGLEELCFPMMAIGAAGMMNAVGNLDPRHVASLHRAMTAGDLEAARKIHFELFEISKAIFFDTNPIPLKYMMKRMGLTDRNEHRPPMAPATAALEQRLDVVLKAAGLIGDRR